VTISELRRAASLLRTLAEVEHADAVGDSREVGRLLAGVDPVEARGIAQRADFDAAVKSLARRIAVTEDVLSIRTPW
jgi:hypothetical protein